MNRQQTASLYELIGGMAAFERIVERFYAGVENDALLRPMYPEDLTDSKRHLVLFLAQYFGGPRTYAAERGHPRMRMRHAPFAIGQAERDAWMRHMEEAVLAEELSSEAEKPLMEYFERTATFLMNRFDVSLA